MTAATLTLTEFLLARIAEDEAVARIAEDEAVARAAVGVAIFTTQTGRWVAEDVRDQYGPVPLVFAITENGAKTQVANFGAAWEPNERRAHIARHDPARVLAECEAKRRIVELHQSWPVLVEMRPVVAPAEVSDPQSYALRASQQIAWLTEQEYRTKFGDEPPTAPVMAALAAVYADHPDYRQEWACA